jgi:ubiquinone/menaquinone biosynthesis C-methylase UbiE
MKDYKGDSRKTFDKMAVSYENHFYGKQSGFLYDKVVSKIESFKHESILDLGCGKGALLEKLKKFNSGLYGADISPEMILYAEKALGNSVELKVADSEYLPWEDNFFDIIACILSFHHYPDPSKSLGEMKRVLKAKGHIAIGELWMPVPLRNLTNLILKSKFNRSGDVKVYSINEWQQMLNKAGFININFEKTKGFYVIITAENEK